MSHFILQMKQLIINLKVFKKYFFKYSYLVLLILLKLLYIYII